MHIKRLNFRLLLCVLCVLCGENVLLAQLPDELRVLSYNIHHGEGGDGKYDLERIARLMLSVSPHVVAVQEVDQGTARASGVDQPAELARLTKMKCIFGRNIDHEGGGYGTAVLTSLPIKGVEHHRLPSHYNGEQRGVQVVELGAGDDTVVFFATHLDYRPEEDERLDSVKKIRSLLPAYGDKPMLLVGDLNAMPESNTMQQFAADWQRSNEEAILTYPAEAPIRQIDYVLMRPAHRWEVVEARVLDEKVASDHRPLLVVLKRLK
jgi:endonuclease/exonuclease/phosphatase family metal-dependent hydrolase